MVLPALLFLIITQAVEKLIASSNASQRSVLGFPCPSSPYWTPASLAAVRARYAGLPGGLQHSEEIEEGIAERERSKKRKISSSADASEK
jgi:hypothetical protein